MSHNECSGIKRRICVSQFLEGLEGVFCSLDNIHVIGRNPQEHDANLCAVYARLEQQALTTNPQEAQISLTQVKFLDYLVIPGHLVPDPDKITTIQNMSDPTNKHDLRLVLGYLPQCALIERYRHTSVEENFSDFFFEILIVIVQLFSAIEMSSIEAAI
jgi:hypothetical protein